MTENSPHILITSELPKRKPTRFDVALDADLALRVANDLRISGLRKCRLQGQIAPVGARDFQLTAQLGATVTQPCVVTLEPVSTRIDTQFTRRYSPDAQPEFGEGEYEMPQDDTLEPLTPQIDLLALLQEELALALPLYPRKDAQDFDGLAVAEKGIAPLRDEDLRPFAGLAALRDKLTKGDE